MVINSESIKPEDSAKKIQMVLEHRLLLLRSNFKVLENRVAILIDLSWSTLLNAAEVI